VLSLVKLAAGGQRYYLEQADGRVDHAVSVSTGVEDYYLGGPEETGRWTGALTRELGLARRAVATEALHRALSWRDPVTGVPKSASVLFGTGDEWIQAAVLGAQRATVADALAYLESTACRGRLGAGGQGAGLRAAGPSLLTLTRERDTGRGLA
jgi:hypothetical protein